MYVLHKTYGLAIWEWLFRMGTIFAKLLQEHKWICHITSGEATSDMTYSRVLLQKLCKNCPRPEKPFSNSKTISLYITYKNSRFNNQKFVILSIKYECALKNSSDHRVVIRKWSLVICKGFFRPWTLCDLTSFSIMLV